MVAQWLGVRLLVRGCGFGPWSGRIPHAAERLDLCAMAAGPAFWSPRATAAEPVCLEPMLHGRSGHCPEKPTRCCKEWPPLTGAGEGPCAVARTQYSQK